MIVGILFNFYYLFWVNLFYVIVILVGLVVMVVLFGMVILFGFLLEVIYFVLFDVVLIMDVV